MQACCCVSVRLCLYCTNWSYAYAGVLLYVSVWLCYSVLMTAMQMRVLLYVSVRLCNTVPLGISPMSEC